MNHIKVQKFVTFLNKNFKINISKIKNRVKCHDTGEYRRDLHSMCNIKYSGPKRIPIMFS